MHTLITIPFSHYCEKARWALQYCRVPFVERGHLPLAHVVPMRRAGGRTLPVLARAGETPLCDSTEIVGWADSQATPERRLFGDERMRARAEALEDMLHEKLGPATRAWVYGHGLSQPDALSATIAPSLSPLQRRVAPWLLSMARPLMTRRYRLSRGRVQEAMRAIESTFISVAETLGDRKFLVGDAFSAADLTFAALAAPVLLPDEHPSLSPDLGTLPDEMRQFIERMRLTPAGKFALKMYRWHR